MMAEPPLSSGAIQERSICDSPLAVAVSPVGFAGMLLATWKTGERPAMRYVDAEAGRA